MLMGFPKIPFRLCDFYAVLGEYMVDDDTWRVIGELPGGTRAVAMFRKQPGPRGSWTAYSLKEV